MPVVNLSGSKIVQYISEEIVQKNIEERGFSSDKALTNLERSDLTVHVYEGGFKVWECSVDLCNYIIENYASLENFRVLELGCGAGLPGIISAQLSASQVTLQDFNECVLKCFTADNIDQNIKELRERCQLVSGRWEALDDKIDLNSFDLILTSETIYNEEDYMPLHEIICKSIKDDGTCLVAAKFFYFGVGGSVPSFMEFIRNQNKLTVEEVADIQATVPRKILKLSKIK